MKSDKSTTPDPGTPDNLAVHQSDTVPSPAVDLKMSGDDFAGLRAQAAAIGQNDVQLGRMLDALVLHLGHAHGLDPVVEDARLAAQARADARDEEDANVKVAAENLAQVRTLEDSRPRTPEQQAALTITRAAEDAQTKADADALSKKRAEEDAITKAAQVGTPVSDRGV